MHDQAFLCRPAQALQRCTFRAFVTEVDHRRIKPPFSTSWCSRLLFWPRCIVRWAVTLYGDGERSLTFPHAGCGVSAFCVVTHVGREPGHPCRFDNNPRVVEHFKPDVLFPSAHSGLALPLLFLSSSTFLLSSSKALTRSFASSFFFSRTWKR